MLHIYILPSPSSLKNSRAFQAANCNSMWPGRAGIIGNIDIWVCTSLGRLADIILLKTLMQLHINHCARVHDIQSIEKFNPAKVCVFEDASR